LALAIAPVSVEAATGSAGLVFRILNSETIFSSVDLSGMQMNLERNPDGGTSAEAPYLPLDGSLTITPGQMGTISANPAGRLVYVNTMVGPKFINKLPDGNAISRQTQWEVFDTRLPRLPLGRNIPQSVNFVMFLYDGNNTFGQGAHRNLEACAEWVLNPWDPNYGKLMVLDRAGILVDTGLSIAPDTQWHHIEYCVNFRTEQYVSLSVDGKSVNFSGDRMYETLHPEWDKTIATFTTLEVTNGWPGDPAQYVCYWSQEFRNYVWGLGSLPASMHGG
jgi:hypothetical protein